ncbi:hypothetical protein BD779DRAFT_1669078 [Infundibulicybe gibba]|nr:hypothetical protein BD779DRAFT_1669078 [Infundibulicybe gibba]
MGDEAGSLNHPQWEHLLSWLKDRGATCTPLVIAKKVSPHSGYGLFSLCAALPSTPLFAIPAAALLNHDSLSPYYPDAHLQLNAFQLVSLHLMLYRPQGDSKCSLDPLFGPYISVLPPNFNLHPLSWFWKDTLGLASPAESRLLRSIPPSVFRSLQDIAKRFQADWIKVLAYMQGCPALQGDCKLAIVRVQQHQSVKMESDFLWAWLNVNTRCIYHRLKPLRSDPDNFTLCPILDFANHSSSKPQTWPKPSNADIWDTSISVKKPKFTLLSPPNVDVQPGEELYLKYGAHSNRFLFIEYGFVNDAQRNISDGDVDLQEDILHLFKQRGALGHWMEERLIEEGYWGDWTIHSSPPPAFPSYRLITTLRLYHLLDT